MKRIKKHGKTFYVLLRKRDRKYLVIMYWTHTYGKVRVDG